MKREELIKLGVPEDKIDEIMNINGQDIENEKKTVTTLKTERDNLQSQLNDVRSKLEGFANVDVDELNGQISKLQQEMANKEALYQKQLADQAFEALLTQELITAKARNPKAVAALLDVETLKESKNQQADIVAAIKAQKESDAYLFDSEKPAGAGLRGVKPGQGRDELPGSKTQPTTLNEAVHNFYTE